MKRLHDRGDTIVEVLLAIAVVSAVLGAAFASSNQSLTGTRQAQERGEATKFVESQLERLKAAASDSASLVFSQTSFCLDDDLMLHGLGEAACHQGQDGRYAVAIARSGQTYTATAEWERIGGGEQERIEMIYRIYP